MASCEDLVGKFNAFCATKGQMTSQENGKLVKDCFAPTIKFKDVFNLTNITDTSFKKYADGKGKKSMTMNTTNIENFLKDCAKEFASRDVKKGDEKAWYAKLVGLLAGSTGKKIAGTAISKTGGVGRMTDTSKYTGSHKERFDETGTGKGKDGREDRHENTGYTGQYKEKDTYDKKH